MSKFSSYQGGGIYDDTPGIYILVYQIKVAANILMGFKIWCQVGVWVTLFSKLLYSREFSNIWFQKLTDIRCKRSLWTIFWKFQKPISIWVLVGGFNFRLGTYNVPPGSSANPYGEARRAEFDGTGGTGGTGWTGGTEYQKGPSIFFKLCRTIELVYIYLYTKKKLPPTFLWVLKFDVKLGFG